MHYSTPSHHGQWMNTVEWLLFEVLAIQNWAYFLPIPLEGVPLLLGILNHAGLKDENDLVLLQLLLPLLVMGDSAPWSTFFPVCYFPELIPQFQAKCPKYCSFSPHEPQWSPRLSLSPISSASIIVAFFFFCFIFNNVFLKRLFMGERKIQWELDLFNHLEIVFFLEVGLLWLLLCVFLYKKFLMALWMRLNLVFLSSRYCCSKHHKLGELSQVPGPSVSSSGLYSFM